MVSEFYFLNKNKCYFTEKWLKLNENWTKKYFTDSSMCSVPGYGTVPCSSILTRFFQTGEKVPTLDDNISFFYKEISIFFCPVYIYIFNNLYVCHTYLLFECTVHKCPEDSVFKYFLIKPYSKVFHSKKWCARMDSL